MKSTLEDAVRPFEPIRIEPAVAYIRSESSTESDPHAIWGKGERLGVDRSVTISADSITSLTNSAVFGSSNRFNSSGGKQNDPTGAQSSNPDASNPADLPGKTDIGPIEWYMGFFDVYFLRKQIRNPDLTTATTGPAGSYCWIDVAAAMSNSGDGPFWPISRSWNVQSTTGKFPRNYFQNERDYGTRYSFTFNNFGTGATSTSEGTQDRPLQLSPLQKLVGVHWDPILLMTVTRGASTFNGSYYTFTLIIEMTDDVTDEVSVKTLTQTMSGWGPGQWVYSEGGWRDPGWTPGSPIHPSGREMQPVISDEIDPIHPYPPPISSISFPIDFTVPSKVVDACYIQRLGRPELMFTDMNGRPTFQLMGYVADAWSRPDIWADFWLINPDKMVKDFSTGTKRVSNITLSATTTRFVEYPIFDEDDPNWQGGGPTDIRVEAYAGGKFVFHIDQNSRDPATMFYNDGGKLLWRRRAEIGMRAGTAVLDLPLFNTETIPDWDHVGPTGPKS